MTTAEIVRHFSGKKIGRSKWLAKCPAHPDRRPSLSITENTRGVGLYCQSNHCTFGEIVKAAGLRSEMLFFDWNPKSKIDRKMMEEFRRKKWEEGTLGRLKRRQAILMWLMALEPTDAYRTMLEGVTAGIEKHLDAADPQRVRMRKFHAAVDRYGWDEVWRRFLLTDKGRLMMNNTCHRWVW